MHSINYLDNVSSGSKDALRFACGSFLRDLLGVWADRARVRFQLVSAHDTTIRVLLLALVNRTTSAGFFWPPYAAHIALEFWRNDASGAVYVVAQYDGETKQMRAPCKAQLCAFADFKALLESHDATDLECHGHHSGDMWGLHP